jgi:hypothetical protein
MMVNAILFVMITLVLSLLFILGFDQLKRIKKEISN